MILCQLPTSFVGLETHCTCFRVTFFGCVLGNISVVVALHLQIEDIGFIAATAGRNELLVQHLQDVVAIFVQLLLDLLLVVSEERKVLAVLGLFLGLDAGDGSPSSSSGADSVFVGNRQEVSLINAELLIKVSDLFHVIEHVLESLSLFADLGKEDELVS